MINILLVFHNQEQNLFKSILSWKPQFFIRNAAKIYQFKAKRLSNKTKCKDFTANNLKKQN